MAQHCDPMETERYVAWRINPQPPATLLGAYRTEAEAKLACETDFNDEK